MAEHYSKYHKDWLEWLGEKLVALFCVVGFIMVFTWQWMNQNG